MSFRSFGLQVYKGIYYTLWNTNVYDEADLTSTNNLCFEQKYEKYQNFLSENFHFLGVNFSVFSVFVMLGNKEHLKERKSVTYFIETLHNSNLVFRATCAPPHPRYHGLTPLSRFNRDPIFQDDKMCSMITRKIKKNKISIIKNWETFYGTQHQLQ